MCWLRLRSKRSLLPVRIFLSPIPTAILCVYLLHYLSSVAFIVAFIFFLSSLCLHIAVLLAKSIMLNKVRKHKQLYDLFMYLSRLVHTYLIIWWKTWNKFFIGSAKRNNHYINALHLQESQTRISNAWLVHQVYTVTASISHCLLGTASGLNTKLRHSPSMYPQDHTADRANRGETKANREIVKESYKRMLDGTIRIGSVRARMGEVGN